MTKHIIIALASAGLLSAPLLAQDIDLGDLDLDSTAAGDDTTAEASDDSSADTATAGDSVTEETADASLEDEETIEEISNGEDSAEADTFDEESTDDAAVGEGIPAPVTTDNSGASGKTTAAESSTQHFFNVVGNKYILVETTNVSYVDSLSSVIVYIGWNTDRQSSWGTGADLAKHSRTISTFYVPLEVTGVSLGGGKINIHGSDADGDKTVSAPYEVFENTITITRPEPPAGATPAKPGTKSAKPAAQEAPDLDFSSTEESNEPADSADDTTSSSEDEEDTEE